jgi:hypothetical protein
MPVRKKLFGDDAISYVEQLNICQARLGTYIAKPSPKYVSAGTTVATKDAPEGSGEKKRKEKRP